MNKKIYLFMGFIGSGKGTQAHLLADKLGYTVFSSGAYYRDLTTQDTLIGKKVADLIDNGILMPEWFHVHVLQEVVFGLNPDEGMVFEGTAKKEPEAKVFHEIMDWADRAYEVIYIDVSEEEAKRRLHERYDIEHRKDDAPESIPTRFEEFRKNTEPAIDFFRSVGNVKDVNGDQPREDVHREVCEILGITS